MSTISQNYTSTSFYEQRQPGRNGMKKRGLTTERDSYCVTTLSHFFLMRKCQIYGVGQKQNTPHFLIDNGKFLHLHAEAHSCYHGGCDSGGRVGSIPGFSCLCQSTLEQDTEAHVAPDVSLVCEWVCVLESAEQALHECVCE